jgi:UDP-GlcNAc:undecaprenyl-phosphate GlcNAc-1-phosphate transferase
MYIAPKIGAMDAPGGRKVHKTPTPRLGGLAIALSILLSILLINIITPSLFDGIRENTAQNLWIGGCVLGLFLLGLWDDLHSLKPGLKFGVQFIIAGLMYYAGFSISSITNPIGGGILNVEFIDFPLTLLWIVGITNAFNLIDGLDGLATGIASIAGLTIFAVSALAGQVWTAALAIILVGALLGFLRYNFNPAKIFLGDSGSLVIGFTLSLLAIQSTTKISTGLAVLFPLIVLGLPITDTMVSMLRRFLGAYLLDRSNLRSGSLLHKLHSMFLPDKSHIHHQLLSLGFTHRNTVLVLYGISAFFAAGALALTQIDQFEQSVTIAILLVLMLYLGIKNLHYREISVFKNGMMMPVYERWILNRTTFLSLIDLAFIVLSFFLSLRLIHSINPSEPIFTNFNTVLIFTMIIQITTYWMFGLYRESIRQMGLGHALRVVSAVFYAVLITAIILLAFGYYPQRSGIAFFVVNFYFLITFTLGIRMAYRALIYWFNRENKAGKNMLIYGANDDGTMMLNKLTTSAQRQINVLGFLDDNPNLEGKRINGYPILGGHWKLANLPKQVDCILICEPKIKPEDFRRLMTQAKAKGIEVKQLQLNY